MQFGVIPSTSGPLHKKLQAMAVSQRRAVLRSSAPVQSPDPKLSPVATQSPEATADIAALVACAAAFGDANADMKVLGRQVAMFLISEKHGETTAAGAFQTIPESVRFARRKMAKVVAAAALSIEPTAECFAQIVTGFVGDSQRPRHSRKDIVTICANAFNVPVYDILSTRRTRTIVRPRQVAMFLCRRLTPASFPEIGKSLGGRDHTTAVHACRKVEAIVARAGLACPNDPSLWAEALAALPDEAWGPA